MFLLIHSREPRPPTEDGRPGLNEAVKQAAVADVLLLNKVDLVTPEVTDAVLAELRSINSTAKVIQTVRSRIDLDLILDLHAYDGQGPGSHVQEDRSLGPSVDPTPLPAKFAENTSDHLSPSYANVGTVTLRHENPVSLKSLEKFLQALLWDGIKCKNGSIAQVLRLKGLMKCAESGRVLILQGVHDTYDTYESETVPEVPLTLVIIGRDLDMAVLKAKLDEVLMC